MRYTKLNHPVLQQWWLIGTRGYIIPCNFTQWYTSSIFKQVRIMGKRRTWNLIGWHGASPERHTINTAKPCIGVTLKGVEIRQYCSARIPFYCSTFFFQKAFFLFSHFTNRISFVYRHNFLTWITHYNMTGTCFWTCSTTKYYCTDIATAVLFRTIQSVICLWHWQRRRTRFETRRNSLHH
jgi:hypothetical protein